MTPVRRSTIAALILLSLLFSFGNVAHAKEKPEIVRLDAEYTEMLVKISVHWQSSNPVAFIRAIVGKEQKELKVDEYDNRRNPDGYSGEAEIVVNAAPTAGMDGIPYVVQIEDDLRQKSEQVTGSVKTPAGLAGGSAAPDTGPAGTGAGAWSASGAWSATGTGPLPGSSPMGGTGDGGNRLPSSGGPQGGATRRGSGRHAAGGSDGTNGGSPSIGDALTKAQEGRPGELIDKTIGFVTGSGRSADGSTNPPEAAPPPTSRGKSGLPQTLQNEKFRPGGKASFVGGLNPEDEVAVVLGPVDHPFTVTKVLFLFGGSSGEGIVTLKISQDFGAAENFEVLFTATIEIQGSDTALQEIDLAEVGGVVPVPAGSVRVSIQMEHDGLPGIGYDMSAKAVPGRNWINRSGIWSDFGTAGIPGNGIVRATVAQ